MKKILLFSSGVATLALVAEALLKTQIKQEKNILFYSSGIEHHQQEIDNAKLMLCTNKIDIQNINLKTHEELFEQEFDLIFILFNCLREKANISLWPLCRGSMFYVGFQGKTGKLDILYKDVEQKIIGRIKSVIMKEFDLQQVDFIQ